MSKYIDKIIYINLDKREDRKNQIEEQFNNYNLEYERFSAIEYKNFGTYGCGMSHLLVLKKAKEQGYKNILIFEDDFEFIVDKETFENELSNLFESGLNFDVCMLAYNLRETDQFDNSSIPSIQKVKFAQTASAYIVNSHYYDKLINLYEWALPLLLTTRKHWIYSNDIVWRKLQNDDNWFYFVNRIGKQRASWSDNDNKFCDYGV